MAKKVTPKKKGRKPKLDPELVAAAIAELRGNVSSVAKRFDVSRTAVSKLIDARPALQSVLTDAREGMLDDAESALYTAALAGEAWAVCFFLKTQGKGRGYTEKEPDGDANRKPDSGLGLLAQVVARLLAQPTDARGEGGAAGDGAGIAPLAPETGGAGGGVPE